MYTSTQGPNAEVCPEGSSVNSQEAARNVLNVLREHSLRRVQQCALLVHEVGFRHTTRRHSVTFVCQVITLVGSRREALCV